VLALPLLALVVLLIRPGVRAGSGALEATALTVMVMIATLAVAVLGDGLADTAKQGHLVLNAALAWLLVGIIMAIPTSRRGAALADKPPERVHPPTERDPG